MNLKSKEEKWRAIQLKLITCSSSDSTRQLGLMGLNPSFKTLIMPGISTEAAVLCGTGRNSHSWIHGPLFFCYVFGLFEEKTGHIPQVFSANSL